MIQTINKNKIKRQPMTVERAVDAVQTGSLMLLASIILEMAIKNMDHDFKNPLVHNRINRMKEDSAFVQKFIRAMPILKEVSTDATDDISGSFYSILQKMIRFSHEEIEGFDGVLAQLMKEAEERDKQLKQK
jgi:acyl-CoA thioesterase